MHQFREVSPAWFIDASRWFIHQQNIRSAYQGKGDKKALKLAARKLANGLAGDLRR